jgi:hypothetical protein
MPGKGKVGGMRGKHERRNDGAGGSDPRGPVQDPIGHDPGGQDGAVDAGGGGRSASSPGHLKKAAGARSARDFAPGHAGQTPGGRQDELA